MYVHHGMVFNSKDLQPIQMPVDDRLDKENVAHIHHEILCSHKKGWVRVFCRTWMNLETIILSKLTQEQNIKHWTFSLIGGCWTMQTHGHREGSITHWGLLWGLGDGHRGMGRVGRDNMGRNAKCGWRGGRQENTLSCVYLCNYLACSAHVSQNLKCNTKNNKIKKSSFLLHRLCQN